MSRDQQQPNVTSAVLHRERLYYVCMHAYAGETVTVTATRRKRSRRCGECTGCKSNDCKECAFYLDMVKYGGPGKKKKCCVQKSCTAVLNVDDKHIFMFLCALHT